MFTTRQVQSWSDVGEYLELWYRLHNQLAPDNPHVSPLWAEIWFCSHSDKKRRTFLLSAPDRGSEGIVLLTKGRTQRFKLPVKSIETIGAGKSPADRHFVSTQEPLLTENAIDPLLESIKACKDWAFFRLAPLPADYPYIDNLVAAAKKYGMTTRQWPYSTGYTIRTEMGWEEYEKSRSKKFRKMIRSAQNKMDKSGMFRIEAHTDPASSHRLLDILQTITMKSWKVEAGSDLFNAAYHGFWKTAFEKTITAGQTTLWVMYCKDQPVGYEWSLRQGRRIIALKADYDRNFSEYSPGNLLAWHILRHCFASDIAEIDYCMGGGDYKKRWATHSYELDELLFFNPTLYSRVWLAILSRQDQIRNFHEKLRRLNSRLQMQR